MLAEREEAVSIWRRFAISIAAVVLLVTPVRADESCQPNEDPVYQAFRCTSNPCIVGDNRGGYIPIYIAAYYELLRRDWTVILTGLCGSSCVLAADWGRNFFKITSETTLGFHKAAEYRNEDFYCVGASVYKYRADAKPKNYSDPMHTYDIIKRVYALHGGFPQEDVWYVPGSQFNIWPVVARGERTRVARIDAHR